MSASKLLVLFEGRKFKGQFEGETRLVGFYANRACNDESVEVFDEVAECMKLVDDMKRLGYQTTPSTAVRAEQMSHFDEVAHADKIGGFTFFPDEAILRRLLRTWTR